jgi:hypothetical protein
LPISPAHEAGYELAGGIICLIGYQLIAGTFCKKGENKMSRIDEALRKYIDRASTDDEMLQAAKIHLLSSMDELHVQVDRLAAAVERRMRPRTYPADYALLKIAATNKVKRAIVEEMSLVRIARRIKAAPGVDIKPLHTLLDRVERKCAVLQALNRDLWRQLDEQIAEPQLVEALKELAR